MRLKWTDLADIDSEKLEAHINENNRAAVAIDVVMTIIDTTHSTLPEYPRTDHQGRIKNTRELVIEGSPYIVIDRDQVAANCIEILRVLHEAQQWPTED